MSSLITARIITMRLFHSKQALVAPQPTGPKIRAQCSRSVRTYRPMASGFLTTEKNTNATKARLSWHTIASKFSSRPCSARNLNTRYELTRGRPAHRRLPVFTAFAWSENCLPADVDSPANESLSTMIRRRIPRHAPAHSMVAVHDVFVVIFGAHRSRNRLHGSWFRRRSAAPYQRPHYPLLEMITNVLIIRAGRRNRRKKSGERACSSSSTVKQFLSMYINQRWLAGSFESTPCPSRDPPKLPAVSPFQQPLYLFTAEYRRKPRSAYQCSSAFSQTAGLHRRRWLQVNLFDERPGA